MPADELGHVLVDDGAADAEQAADRGNGVVWPGQQIAGMLDVPGRHGWLVEKVAGMLRNVAPSRRHA